MDFGGCRCQAFALTGDAAENADPVCTLSPHRSMIDAALAGRERTLEYRYRNLAGEPQRA